MDQQVVDAQRAYGAFLAAEPGRRRELESAAREHYKALFERACHGDYESQRELGRLIHEPKSLQDLDIDPVQIVIRLPSAWADHLLTGRTFSADELVAVINGQIAAGRDSARATAELVKLAQGSGDLSALEWLSRHSGEPARSTAFAGLGDALLRRAQAINAAAIENQHAASDTAPLLGRIAEWLRDTGSYSTPPSVESALRHEERNLRWRQARKNGLDIHRELAACFQIQVADLAGWLRAVDHLLRRVDTWMLENSGESHLTEIRSDLGSYAAWARANRWRWGAEHMASSGFGPGQILPGFEGTCVNCASALDGRPFCRQCGTRSSMAANA